MQTSLEGQEVIDTLAEQTPGKDVGMVVCPHCRAYVAANLIKTGELWDIEENGTESADSEAKEADADSV